MDRIRNQEVRERSGVAPLSVKLRENNLRWFGHVKRKTVDAAVRLVESLIVESKISQGRPKKTWTEQLNINLSDLLLFEDSVTFMCQTFEVPFL